MGIHDYYSMCKDCQTTCETSKIIDGLCQECRIKQYKKGNELLQKKLDIGTQLLIEEQSEVFTEMCKEIPE